MAADERVETRRPRLAAGSRVYEWPARRGAGAGRNPYIACYEYRLHEGTGEKMWRDRAFEQDSIYAMVEYWLDKHDISG